MGGWAGGDAAAVDGDRVGEGRGGLCEEGEGEVMWGRGRSRSLSSLSLRSEERRVGKECRN